MAPPRACFTVSTISRDLGEAPLRSQRVSLTHLIPNILGQFDPPIHPVNEEVLTVRGKIRRPIPADAVIIDVDLEPEPTPSQNASDVDATSQAAAALCDFLDMDTGLLVCDMEDTDDDWLMSDDGDDDELSLMFDPRISNILNTPIERPRTPEFLPYVTEACYVNDQFTNLCRAAWVNRP